MIGLAVYLNGKRKAVAGADDLCVLSAIVTAVGELGASTASVGKRHGVDLHLSVGGLTRRAETASIAVDSKSGRRCEQKVSHWASCVPLRQPMGDFVPQAVAQSACERIAKDSQR